MLSIVSPLRLSTSVKLAKHAAGSSHFFKSSSCTPSLTRSIRYQSRSCTSKTSSGIVGGHHSSSGVARLSASYVMRCEGKKN
jgi:hypothetical protein